MNDIEKNWSAWRRKHEVEKAQEESPKLREWLEGLKPGFKKSAEKLIAKLSALPVDKEEDRKVLYKHGILAFERMQLQGSAEELAQGVESVDALLSILADRDAIEASLYRDIVKSRLEAVKEFQSLVDDDQKEKALQEYLFDHLWLLDPAWERATDSPLMEDRLLEEGVIVEDLTQKEKLGRVDIAYRTNAGKHLIIELKRASVKPGLLDLQAQGSKYVDKLRKILDSKGESEPNIEVVFVLGRALEEEKADPERVKSAMNYIAPGSRIVHYDSLIEGAQNAYKDYIDKTADLDKLDDIVNSL